MTSWKFYKLREKNIEIDSSSFQILRSKLMRKYQSASLWMLHSNVKKMPQKVWRKLTTMIKILRNYLEHIQQKPAKRMICITKFVKTWLTRKTKRLLKRNWRKLSWRIQFCLKFMMKNLLSCNWRRISQGLTRNLKLWTRLKNETRML